MTGGRTIQLRDSLSTDQTLPSASPDERMEKILRSPGYLH